jgi:hypothetical protein
MGLFVSARLDKPPSGWNSQIDENALLERDLRGSERVGLEKPLIAINFTIVGKPEAAVVVVTSP